MKVQFNWPDHLILFAMHHPKLGRVFDLFINSILLENDADTPKRITRAVIDVTEGHETIWRWEFPQPALEDHLKIDWQLSAASLPHRMNVVGAHLAPGIRQLVPGPTLQPGEQAIIRRLPVRFSTRRNPEKLVIRVYSGQHLIGRNTISLKSVENFPAFSFPVKGTWQVFNNFDFTLAHRQCASQEFAMDLIRLGENSAIKNESENGLKAYSSYDQPVYSIAGGTVVRVMDGLPDNPPESKLSESRLRDDSSTDDFIGALAGNYVVIRHENNVFSFYAHLRKNSIVPREGDTMDAGEMLARVGNSGLSRTPHLHFQVNEGDNPLADRSIPLFFKDITDIFGKKIEFIVQNLSIVHAGK